MDCAGTRPSLALLAEGRLAELDAERVRAHVAGCARCAQLLELEEALRRSVRMPAPAPDTPQPSASAVLVRARRAAAVAWLITVLLAVALLALLAASGASQDGTPPAPRNPAQLQGVLTCVPCELRSGLARDAVSRTLLPESALAARREHARAPLALRDESGRVWQLVPAPELEEVLSDHAKVSRRATVFGRVSAELGAVLVERALVD